MSATGADSTPEAERVSLDAAPADISQPASSTSASGEGTAPWAPWGSQTIMVQYFQKLNGRLPQGVRRSQLKAAQRVAACIQRFYHRIAEPAAARAEAGSKPMCITLAALIARDELRVLRLESTVLCLAALLGALAVSHQDCHAHTGISASQITLELTEPDADAVTRIRSVSLGSCAPGLAGSTLLVEAASTGAAQTAGRGAGSAQLSESPALQASMQDDVYSLGLAIASAWLKVPLQPEQLLRQACSDNPSAATLELHPHFSHAILLQDAMMLQEAEPSFAGLGYDHEAGYTRAALLRPLQGACWTAELDEPTREPQDLQPDMSDISDCVAHRLLLADLLARMLNPQARSRIAAAEALQHPLFLSHAQLRASTHIMTQVTKRDMMGWLAGGKPATGQPAMFYRWQPCEVLTGWLALHGDTEHGTHGRPARHASARGRDRQRTSRVPGRGRTQSSSRARSAGGLRSRRGSSRRSSPGQAREWSPPPSSVQMNAQNTGWVPVVSNGAGMLFAPGMVQPLNSMQYGWLPPALNYAMAPPWYPVMQPVFMVPPTTTAMGTPPVLQTSSTSGLASSGLPSPVATSPVSTASLGISPRAASGQAGAASADAAPPATSTDRASPGPGL